jgi:hypothetical protein
MYVFEVLVMTSVISVCYQDSFFTMYCFTQRFSSDWILQHATKGYLKLLIVTAAAGDTGTSQRCKTLVENFAFLFVLFHFVIFFFYTYLVPF